MNWKAKVGIAAGIIALFAVLLLIIKYQHDIIQKQKHIDESLVAQKQLINDITRAQSSYASSKDIENFAKELNVKLKPIKKDLDEFEASVKGIHKFNVSSAGVKSDNLASSRSDPRSKETQEDKVEQNENILEKHSSERQILVLDEPFKNSSVPFGEVGFSAWKQKPWDLTIHPREYNVVNVLGVDEDGKHYVYSKFYVDVNGEKHFMNIDDAMFLEEYPESKFRFSPRLYLALDGGAYVTDVGFELTPSIQAHLFSYGRTKANPDWTFLGVGVGYETQEKRPAAVLSPVNYNIGKHIPLTENIFIGPQITVDTNADIAVQAGIKVGL